MAEGLALGRVVGSGFGRGEGDGVGGGQKKPSKQERLGRTTHAKISKEKKELDNILSAIDRAKEQRVSLARATRKEARKTPEAPTAGVDHFGPAQGRVR